MTAAVLVQGNARSTGLFMLLQAADFIESRDTDRKPESSGLEDHNYHAQQLHRPPHLQLKNPSLNWNWSQEVAAHVVRGVVQRRGHFLPQIIILNINKDVHIMSWKRIGVRTSGVC